MALLSFILRPEAVSRVHDAVLCLAKFSETISMEAHIDKLILSALNTSKSSYASFSFKKTIFFERYELALKSASTQQSRNDAEPQFTCQLYNKALLSVFKGQLKDLRDKDTGLERCECQIQEQPEKTECRLIIKIVCRHGVTKTYKLTYESVELMRALFNADAAKNVWRISAIALRSFTEYFGANTEQLDISSEGGRATFTSYTEKVLNGKEILKRPMQTSVTVDTLEFEKFEVEEQLHIGIMLKDFKSISMHAETLKTSITAKYSFPARPIRFSYSDSGMECEFTLMTIGEYRGPSQTPGGSRQASAALAEKHQQQPDRQQTVVPTVERSKISMPPPDQPASRSFNKDPRPSHSTQRPSPPPPKPSLDPESLFLPQYDDEDRQWAERNYDDEEDTVGWSASALNTRKPAIGPEAKAGFSRLEPSASRPENAKDVLLATQRLSQVEDLFGD